MKKVLILNASHNDERMIKALKELNFYVKGEKLRIWSLVKRNCRLSKRIRLCTVARNGFIFTGARGLR